MMNRKLLVVGVVVAAGAVLGTYRHVRSRDARDELLEIDRKIELGAEESKVEHECRRADFKYVTCLRRGTTIGFGTPGEFGAKNWVLYVGLERGLVVTKRYRTADSEAEHPSNSPGDVGEGPPYVDR
jgi:hypothetical protein